jgi:regulator of sigma E protease
VELLNGLIAATSVLDGSTVFGATSLVGSSFASFSGSESLLMGATEPSFISWLLGKIWIWAAVAMGVGLVIFVHELGHFLAAKLFGVKVEKFYVGFDVPITILGIKLPRSFGRFRWGETEYGIGVIPLGGYVKMLGQDDDPRQAAIERERIRLAQPGSEEAIDTPIQTLDPRSYPAKTVWQRMVIISAGVVMNLITSVFFAAIAFGFGVSYTPAVIGTTSPGDPAWEAGLEPGGRIVSVGGIEGDSKLHFMDMRMEILKASIDNPEQPVKIQVQYGEEIRDYQLMTRMSNTEPKLPLIGIGAPIAAKLGSETVAAPNSIAATVLDSTNANSDIVAIDGKAIEINDAVGVALADELAQTLVTKRSEPIQLTLRNGEGTADVTLPPQRLKTLGVKFSAGKVAALVLDGPAAKAGAKVGDRIVGLGADGEAIDAVSLPGRVLEAEGSVILRLERGNGESLEKVDVTIVPSELNIASDPFSGSFGKVELATLGLTYQPEPAVVAVDAEATDLQAGDILKRVIFQFEDKDFVASMEDTFSKKTLKLLESGWEINDENNLSSLIGIVQMLPVGTSVELKSTRGEQQTVVEAKSVIQESEAEYWYDRGVVLSPVSLIHKADSVGEAFSLGMRESKRKLGEVFGFLRMIFTGRVGLNHIGGPGAIVVTAGAAASIGITSLLLFLTLLSVNLAVLNFLPIPALDGGHMVFLIAEAVRGKPVDEELQAKLTMAGVLGLLSLMAFVIINDYFNISRMM